MNGKSDVICPRKKVVVDICNSVVPRCKTELQISLYFVSTSHNYVTDFLIEKSNYSKCNYD